MRPRGQRRRCWTSSRSDQNPPSQPTRMTTTSLKLPSGILRQSGIPATHYCKPLQCTSTNSTFRRRLFRSSGGGEKSGYSPRSSAPSSRSASPASLISTSSDDDELPVGSSAASTGKINSDDDDIVVVREIPFNERAGTISDNVSHLTNSPGRGNPSSKGALSPSPVTEVGGEPRSSSPDRKKQRMIDRDEQKVP